MNDEQKIKDMIKNISNQLIKNKVGDDSFTTTLVNNVVDLIIPSQSQTNESNYACDSSDSSDSSKNKDNKDNKDGIAKSCTPVGKTVPPTQNYNPPSKPKNADTSTLINGGLNGGLGAGILNGGLDTGILNGGLGAGILDMFTPMARAFERSDKSKEVKLSCKAPYDLVTALYRQLWTTPNVEKVNDLYETNAMLSYVSEPEDSNWSITGRSKIVDFYQKIWLPHVKNMETEILEFNFKKNTACNENGQLMCSVNYHILQIQLNNSTMKWSLYDIKATEQLILSHSNNIFKIVTHSIINTDKTLKEELDNY